MISYKKWIDLPPPENLFHYTSVDSFYKICKSVTFYATNIFYLNDSKEYIEGQNLFIKELSKIDLQRLNQTAIDQTKALIKQHTQYINGQGASPILHNQHVFIVSFSKKYDDLSQWRAYCSDGGILLGMKGNELARIAKIQTNKIGFRLIQCIYENKKKIKLIKELIEWYIENEIPISKLLNRVAQLSCSFKDDAFKDECEWRLVYSDIKWSDDSEDSIKENHLVYNENLMQILDFRTRESMLIPFIKFELNPEIFDKEKIAQYESLKDKTRSLEKEISQQQKLSSIPENLGEIAKIFNTSKDACNSIYERLGDKTKLPRPLFEIMIGPGDYSQELLKSAISNYILTKINVESSYVEYRTVFDRLQNLKEIYWQQLAYNIKISKIPFRKRL